MKKILNRVVAIMVAFAMVFSVGTISKNAVKGDVNAYIAQVEDHIYCYETDYRDDIVVHFPKTNSSWEKVEDSTDYKTLKELGFDVYFIPNSVRVIGKVKKVGYAEIKFTFKDSEKNVFKVLFRIYAKYYTKSAELDKYTVYYCKKLKKPTITVQYGGINAIGKIVTNKDYQDDYLNIEFDNNVKLPGSYKVYVRPGKLCAGSNEISYMVKIKNSKIKSIKSGKKKMTVKFKKVDKKYISKYQIRYSTNKKMKKYKKVSVDVKKDKKTIKKLKHKKKYYVQIRTYMKIDGKKYYSKWSKYKKVKVK